MVIFVDLGDAYVTRDGKIFYDSIIEFQLTGKTKTVQDIEDIAKKDPDHDWKIIIYAPSHGETFQRHDENKWICIESNYGFD